MIASVSSLLSSVGVMLLGVGFLGTLLGVRAFDAGFSSSATGLIMSAYYLGYLAGTWWCPAIIRRVGFIRAFSAFAAIASVTALCHGIIVVPAVWLVLRFVCGVVLFGLYMVIEGWLNVVATNETRGRVFTAYMAVNLGGISLGQFLLLVGVGDPLLPFALVSIFVAMAVVPVALMRVGEPAQPEAGGMGFRALLAASPLGMMGTVLCGLANGAFWGLGAVYAQRLALSEAAIALFMTAVVVGGAVLQPVIGVLSDRFDRRWVLIATALAAALLGFGLALLTHASLPVLLSVAFVYGGAAFAIYSLSVAHTNDHLTSDQILAATRGLLVTYGVGAVVGPSLGGLAMGASRPGGLFAYCAVVWGALFVYGLYRVTRRAPVPAEAQQDFVAMMRTSPTALELSPAVAVEREETHGDPAAAAGRA